MNIKEISVRQIANHIDDTYSLKDFFALIKGYGYQESLDYFTEKTNLRFKLIDDYRSEGSGDYDSWDYIFSLEDYDSNKRFFMAQAAYSSYGGVEFYDYQFLEVVQVEVTKKEWVTV